MYQIPPNLQRHMLQVAAVGELLREHWQGPPVHWQVVRMTLLLHDMGNIIKFKRPFLGELESDAPHWEQVQQAYVAKYGSNVHEATGDIIRELPLAPSLQKQVLHTLDGMQKMFNHQSDLSWETRVVEFADCVVTPAGITDFETRMADLHFRYGKTDPSWQLPFRENAQLMQEQVDIDLAEIAQHDVTAALQQLAQTIVG